MKIVFLSFLITLSIYLFGQNISIYKTWIGNSNEYLKITDSIVYFDHGYYIQKFTHNLSRDTLMLIDNSRDCNNDLHTVPFKIIKLTYDSLVLKPLSDYAKRISGNNETFNFVDSANTYNQDFKFEGIFFSGTSCLGSCPGMMLEIDSAGNMFFFGKIHTGKYKGLYRSKLSSENFNKLIDILKRSSLDNFPEHMGVAIDAPEYNFVFFYNGKKKESEGTFVPYFNRDLLDFLLDCYKSSGLKKVKYSRIIPPFSHGNHPFFSGKYQSVNGFPVCNVEVLNDSIILVDSSSLFYFHDTGKAKYNVEKGHVFIDFSKYPVQISNLACNNNDDSIFLDFYTIDKEYDIPLCFADILLSNQKGDTMHIFTDVNAYARVKMKKSFSPLEVRVSYVMFQELRFNVIPDCNKKVYVNFEHKRIYDFTIKKVNP